MVYLTVRAAVVSRPLFCCVHGCVTDDSGVIKVCSGLAMFNVVDAYKDYEYCFEIFSQSHSRCNCFFVNFAKTLVQRVGSHSCQHARVQNMAKQGAHVCCYCCCCPGRAAPLQADNKTSPKESGPTTFPVGVFSRIFDL